MLEMQRIVGLNSF
uniref:Uncharacterized protein n=1 Tax=Anguilla anguilla TaxID=7936 RepID=A0A0E9SLH6_ANGAN